MTNGHAPYLMPDGRSLAAVLKAEGPTHGSLSSKRKNSTRPKDELWGQLQMNKRSALSDAELAEIRAIERVGARRRRQWLNDKLLRDLAGPMSTHDMEGQFKPIPFGMAPPPSAFTLAAAPEHAAVWDHFRSIDSDKEARVLQAWEAHNRQQQHVGSYAVLAHQQATAAAAACALSKWSRVDRRSRAALKKASHQALAALELQALNLLQQGDPTAQLLLDLPDGFARLLMHGLAQFHNLHSTTCLAGGQKAVLLQHRQGSNTPSPSSSSPSSNAQQQDRTQQPSAAASVASTEEGEGVIGVSSINGGVIITHRQGEGSGGGRECGVHATDEHQVLHGGDVITCTDVVMALQELGDSLSHHSLERYIHSVHGSSSMAYVTA